MKFKGPRGHSVVKPAKGSIEETCFFFCFFAFASEVFSESQAATLRYTLSVLTTELVE